MAAAPRDTIKAFSKEREAQVGAQRNFSSEQVTLDIARSVEKLEKEPRLPRTANVSAF